MTTSPLTNPLQKPLPAFVLSSETDHAPLPVTFRLAVKDRRYQGNLLSLTGGEVSGLASFDDTTTGLGILIFPFEGYQLTVPAEVELKRDPSSDTGRIEFKFVNPAGDHLAHIRYVLNSVIAGDLVSMEQILSVRKDRPTRAKSKPDVKASSRFSRVAKGFASLALGLALLAGGATLIDQRLLTVVEQRPAEVVSTAPVLRAPSAGQVALINEAATEGTLAFVLQSVAGYSLSIQMPCDCGVQAAHVENGATVLAGEPIMTLNDPNAALRIDATMSYEGVRRLMRGDGLRLRFNDGSVVTANIVPGSLVAAADPALNDLAQVQLSVPNIEARQAGELAEVRIHRNLAIVEVGREQIRALVARLFVSLSKDGTS